MRPSLAYRAAVLTIVVTPLVGVALAIRTLWQRSVTWTDLILLLVIYSLVAFGVTVGYHRMLTHRSFKPHPVVKFILLVLGSMAFEGPAIQWAATHTKHHAVSDREGDPHSPVDGFFHAHLGWLFTHPNEDPNVWARHLVKDPIIMFVSKTFLLWGGLSLVIPFIDRRLAGLDLGRAGAHVPDASRHLERQLGLPHLRQARLRDERRSRNEWVVGLLAFGEGWHNNHHAFPRSAFHGLRWWQLDFSGLLIASLEKVGLATDVYRIPPDLMNRQARRTASLREEPAAEEAPVAASVSALTGSAAE